ncbi:FimV/HubP family polar landmark protein [Polynucleobacter sp. AP-RePozz3-80-G7]|jgi:pilus assembly protein FimV|uniref:FimV/HubP family polar landmark protein n=1 Tax=Polynucleobacter sp. AP-RePozz3-80-G7 TaxID=2689105 RepID=UPI001C0B642C|nr:FimV/HubP family polar landmark protein [Polynucleobacter sp. AP-RePozz3-80-G7]MBU3639037.1 pilus assembly protein FimV [Polynucleobacter sp. AP-RePozz3-80-G7]
MFRIGQLGLKLLCVVLLSWSSIAGAISLGAPQLQSRPGEPLRVEIPVRVGADEQAALSTLNVTMPNKASYERLGISQKILDLNPQAMVYRNRQEQLMVLVETVNSVPMTDDPFLDVLVNLNWSSGSLTKTFTLLLGDVQKITVKPGQSLSEIAAIMAPQLDGANLDQTMMALYKANPDAFASGSINRLAAGAELSKPSQALLRSISPAEANQFVADANEQWRTEHDEKDAGAANGKSGNAKTGEVVPKDRLKIGSSADGNDQERRYTEELVAQEKMLEQTKARVAELEKNIADLHRLLDKSKEKKAVDSNFGLGGFGPAILAIGLIGLTGLLLWGLARNARRSEAPSFHADTHHVAKNDKPAASSHFEMPARAKALFDGIDLDLSKPAKEVPVTTAAPASNPLADTLRVKLNLARAYITIEDFSAAKKSLDEVLRISNSVDPAITIEAQGLLAEISHRNT